VIRAGGTLVTVTGPTEARPSGGLTIDFAVVPDRAQLSELVQRLDGLDSLPSRRPVRSRRWRSAGAVASFKAEPERAVPPSDPGPRV
jgi:hypothetical protein